MVREGEVPTSGSGSPRPAFQSQEPESLSFSSLKLGSWALPEMGVGKAIST